MGMHQPMTGAQRVAKRRAALRAQGLRLKQLWVPDLRNAKVRAQLRREADEINRRDRASGAMAEIEALGEGLLEALPPYGGEPRE